MVELQHVWDALEARQVLLNLSKRSIRDGGVSQTKITSTPFQLRSESHTLVQQMGHGHLGEGASQFDVRRCGELPFGAHGERAGVQAVQVGHDQQQVGRGLDGQEAAARHVDAEGVVEGFNGCAHRRFQLDDVLPAVKGLTTKRGEVLVENMLLFFFFN